MDLNDLATIRDLGAYGLMSLALIGGFRGWYIWRWQHEAALAVCREAIADRDALIAKKEQAIERLVTEKEQWEARTITLLDVNKLLAERVGI